ncbi:MAG TPA: LD-carboxypeptidase [Candidatus Binatia bacterium]|jgi:muramoyltetrapeptide carboxypeptidase|nr:LD-carboxypeptidase [Candidatus Binatia bacterium]
MSLCKPSRLCPGDLIGVISPAAAVPAEALRRGCAELERLGFSVRVGPHVLDRHGFLAGTDRDRAHDLTTMFQDPAVRAIFCSRAGYGSGRLFPLLDFPALAQTPKIFLGFSDVTLLLNAFVQQAGLICFHGPVVAGEVATGFSPRALSHLLGLLMTGTGEERLTFPTVIRDGVAEGRLLGGCLSLLVTTLGTPFALDTSGAILFIEDVGEKPYRIDRMLTHLKQAGKLNDLAGVIFGSMSGCLGDGNDPALLLSVIADVFSDYSYPVGFGLPAGHGEENLALPLGARVRLDTVRRHLTFLEPAVL